MTAIGEVSSRQAYAALEADSNAVLVDVRTAVEHESVGLPDVSRLVLVAWTRGDGSPDPAFLDQLSAARVSTDLPVYFLCRSGQRSRAAARAATSAGYRRSFNISDGFEGPPDASGLRTVAGWKNEGLPWRVNR